MDISPVTNNIQFFGRIQKVQNTKLQAENTQGEITSEYSKIARNYGLSSINFEGSAGKKDLKQFKKTLRDNPNYTNEEADYILRWANKDNAKVGIMMLKNEKFPKEEISEVLKFTNPENSAIGELIVGKEDFPYNHTAEIIRKVNKDNTSLAHVLISDSKFPKEKVAAILYRTNQDNEEAKLLHYTFLKWNEKTTGKEVGNKILSLMVINDKNFDLVRKMSMDKDFPMRSIDAIFSNNSDTRLDAMTNLYNFIQKQRDNLAVDYSEALISLGEVTDENLEDVISNLI